MSTDLQWYLLRKYNSFTVKRLVEGPIFSKEPGNLLNIHSHKYSGFANAKTIDIQETPSGIKIVTRKKKASPHAVKSAYSHSTIRNRSGSRRASGAASGIAKNGYRPDLRRAAVARASALIAAHREPKTYPAKKPRGKKGKSYAAVVTDGTT